jgi:hypothetical protein
LYPDLVGIPLSILIVIILNTFATLNVNSSSTSSDPWILPLLKMILSKFFSPNLVAILFFKSMTSSLLSIMTD